MEKISLKFQLNVERHKNYMCSVFHVTCARKYEVQIGANISISLNTYYSFMVKLIKNIFLGFFGDISDT